MSLLSRTFSQILSPFRRLGACTDPLLSLRLFSSCVHRHRARLCRYPATEQAAGRCQRQSEPQSGLSRKRRYLGVFISLPSNSQHGNHCYGKTYNKATTTVIILRIYYCGGNINYAFLIYWIRESHRELQIDSIARTTPEAQLTLHLPCFAAPRHPIRGRQYSVIKPILSILFIQ